jgi:hypothetical protein
MYLVLAGFWFLFVSYPADLGTELEMAVFAHARFDQYK